MTRELILAALVALLIVAAEALLLMFVAPAHGAEMICGTASWYGQESGSRTRSGEFFDGSSMTAAMIGAHHIGERYRVHRGKLHVDVRINDTGGFAKYGRLIDLSRAAAARIGLIGPGTGKVCLERLSTERVQPGFSTAKPRRKPP